jgi:hypothetical protein
MKGGVTTTDWISALSALVVAAFTIALFLIARRQAADTKILQRAYVSVDHLGINFDTKGDLVGQVAFKNVGKLPATKFTSVVKNIEVQDEESTPPPITDDALPKAVSVIPIGGEVLQGSGPVSLTVVNQAPVTGPKYLYVYGRAKFRDGFGGDRHVNFCHRYPWAMATATDLQSVPFARGLSPVAILKDYARYHQHGNDAD